MEQIQQKNVSDMYVDCMIIYMIECNLRRAFADGRDGLKLVQRRILFDMFNDTQASQKLVKSSRIVGDTMGKYHPHGNTSIYGALKTMANWFDTYIPLTTGHGNLGSMQGDGPAADRYTEAKLSQFAIDIMFTDLSKTRNIVDWCPNYDYTLTEPEYLPVCIPLLLVNGANGIGTGKTVNIPPHNLGEVIDATIALMKDPSVEIVLKPDQRMPCEIIETNWKSICNSGHGTFKVRSIVDIEIDGKGTAKEHPVLVVRSMPDFVSFDKGKGSDDNGGGVLYKIYDLIEKGKLPQIEAIKEDSHDDNMRIAIHLKRGSDPEYVKQYLYKTGLLQKTQLVNFEVLNGLSLDRFSYKSYLLYFIELQKNTKFRYANLLMQEVNTKYHEMDALIKCIDSDKLDEIIRRIRVNGSDEESDNVTWLCKTLKITDLQALFILNLKIKSLRPYNISRYREQLQKYISLREWCMERIHNEKSIEADIIEQMLYIKEKYNFKKKCIYIREEDATNIPKGEFNVVITESNYIKKLPTNEYIGTYRGDNPIHIIKADNTKDVLIFTSQGKVFKLPVSKIPIAEKGSSGVDLRILIKGLLSDVVGVLYLPHVEQMSRLVNKHYIVVSTKYNKIKKVDLDDFINVPLSGFIYTKLNDGDIVSSILVSPDTLDIIIYSNKKALRCPMSDIPYYKRNTTGSAAMAGVEEIDGVSVIYPDSTDILVVTESGKINRFDISGMKVKNRNKAGAKVIELDSKDTINSIFGVNDSTVLKVITRNTKIDIHVKDIPKLSSISKGTNMISNRGDNIVKITVAKNK